MPRHEELQDEQWASIEPLLRRRRSDGRGRPPGDDRAVLNGIVWILRCGARWKDLPARFPSYPTCHRRFQPWVEDGTLSRGLQWLAEDRRSRGQIDIEECFIDATFASAKKGALELALLKPTRSRSSKQRLELDSLLSPPND